MNVLRFCLIKRLTQSQSEKLLSISYCKREFFYEKHLDLLIKK